MRRGATAHRGRLRLTPLAPLAALPGDAWRLIASFACHGALHRTCRGIRAALRDPVVVRARQHLPETAAGAHLTVLEYEGPWTPGVAACLRTSPCLETARVTLRHATDAHLAALPLPPSLLFLRLFATDGSVGDAGFSALCGALRDLRRLHLLELDASRNRIGPKGVSALARSLPRTVMRVSLCLGSNALRGPACTAHLGAMLNRRFLDVRLFLAPNALGKREVRAFLAASADGMVVRDHLLIDVADVCILWP